MTRAKTKQGKERLAHPLGQFKISGTELRRLVAEKYIESTTTPLVRLEERVVPQASRPPCRPRVELFFRRSKARRLWLLASGQTDCTCGSPPTKSF